MKLEFSTKITLVLLVFSFLSFTMFLSSTAGVNAQDAPCFGFGDAPCDPTGGEGGSNNNSGVGTIDKTKLGVPDDINNVISGVVQLLYAVAGIVFFFMFLLGGIRYITAGGDEKAAMAARGTLTQAVIGLVIVVAAFLITQLLFTIFGIKAFIQLG